METPERPQRSSGLPVRRSTSPRRRSKLSRVWLAIGAAAVVLLLAYGATRIFWTPGTSDQAATEVPREEDPGIDGIIAANAPASQFLPGDCLKDFTGPLEPATIVTCPTAHNAQFIGTSDLDGTGYPGDAAVEEEAEAACKAIELAPDASIDSTWSYQFSRPSQGTWADGDRTVACFLSLSEGTIQTSLLPASKD